MYDTVTKPALNAWSTAFFSKDTDVAAKKSACDAAARSGATRNELAEAIGGMNAWNGFVRSLKAAKLT